jgi:hypothetical protein
MTLDHLKLGSREFAWLIQDVERHHGLAQVVEKTRHAG